MKTVCDKLLASVSASRLVLSDPTELERLACAFWHENYVPSHSFLNSLSVEERAVAGYLIEFFSGFNE